MRYLVTIALTLMLALPMAAQDGRKKLTNRPSTSFELAPSKARCQLR